MATSLSSLVLVLLQLPIVSEAVSFMAADIRDFYLSSDLETPEYMWLTRSQVPPATLATFGDAIVWVGDRTLVRINKGLYGLPHAGRLAKEKLIALLARNGYNMTAFSDMNLVPSHLHLSWMTLLLNTSIAKMLSISE